MLKSIYKYLVSFILMVCLAVVIAPASVAQADGIGTGNSFDSPQLPITKTDALGYVVLATNNYTNTVSTRGGSNFDLLKTADAGNNTVIYFNITDYNKQPNKIKQQILDKFITTLNSSNVSGRDQNRIMTWIGSVDETNATVVRAFSKNTQTDLAGAQHILLPFSGPLGTILGILSIVIAALLVFSCSWDIAWLVLPAFQLVLNRGGSKDLSVKNRPLLVSGDAVVAELRYIADSSKGVLSYYLRLRTSTAILIGLCLAYITSNQIWNLLGWVMETLSRFVSIFAN